MPDEPTTPLSELPAVARPWVTLGERYGLPLILLGMVGLLFWRAAVWFEPRASQLFDEHVKTVRELRVTSAKQTEILEGLDKRGAETGVLVREIHEHVTRPHGIGADK